MSIKLPDDYSESDVSFKEKTANNTVKKSADNASNTSGIKNDFFYRKRSRSF